MSLISKALNTLEKSFIVDVKDKYDVSGSVMALKSEWEERVQEAFKVF